MNKFNRLPYFIHYCTILIFFLPKICVGLVPENVFIVVNETETKSVPLALYYAQKRGIPEAHIIHVRTTTEEVCSRDEYEREIASPVRGFLQSSGLKDVSSSCVVLMYGIPLRIVASRENGSKKLGQLRQIEDTGASVDSEIMLVYESNYPRSGWIENPLLIGADNQNVFVDKTTMIMVSRLDGPSPKVVKRIIDHSLEAEKNGLKGTAYFDARWPEVMTDHMSGYAQFDKLIHQAARKVRKFGVMPVVLDSAKALFPEKSCPEAALYCGWYSLGNYIDSFQWTPGSIGYHVASSECTTLKKQNSRVWCKMMLEKGITATMGPVDEPYVQAFPHPDIFFECLLKGMCLAESYLKSIPFLSWKMVLVGDPLYTPFPAY